MWRKKLANAATGGVVEKNVLKNFVKFTGKHCKSPTLLKRDSNTGVYLTFKNTISTIHLRVTASDLAVEISTNFPLRDVRDAFTTQSNNQEGTF